MGQKWVKMKNKIYFSTLSACYIFSSYFFYCVSSFYFFKPLPIVQLFPQASLHLFSPSSSGFSLPSGLLSPHPLGPFSSSPSLLPLSPFLITQFQVQSLNIGKFSSWGTLLWLHLFKMWYTPSLWKKVLVATTYIKCGTIQANGKRF